GDGKGRAHLSRAELSRRVARQHNPTHSSLMRSTIRILAVAGLFSFLVTIARGDSEIVIAIRYLQAEGISHSHLYLYREDGKLLRQLTNDNSGQDVAPIFDSSGETIVFTREKPHKIVEYWTIKP